MTDVEIIQGLLEIAEKHEWIFEDDGRGEMNCCWECGAKYRAWQNPKIHKPGCTFETIIRRAKKRIDEMLGKEVG